MFNTNRWPLISWWTFVVELLTHSDNDNDENPQALFPDNNKKRPFPGRVIQITETPPSPGGTVLALG